MSDDTTAERLTDGPSIDDLRRAIADPGSFLPRGNIQPDGTSDYLEPITAWGARAVHLLIQQHHAAIDRCGLTIGPGVTCTEEVADGASSCGRCIRREIQRLRREVELATADLPSPEDVAAEMSRRMAGSDTAARRESLMDAACRAVDAVRTLRRPTPSADLIDAALALTGVWGWPAHENPIREEVLRRFPGLALALDRLGATIRARAATRARAAGAELGDISEDGGGALLVRRDDTPEGGVTVLNPDGSYFHLTAAQLAPDADDDPVTRAEEILERIKALAPPAMHMTIWELGQLIHNDTDQGRRAVAAILGEDT